MEQSDRWHLKNGANSHVFDGRVRSSRDTTVAFVNLGTPESKLIVASPELLEACREALHYISDIDNAHRTVKQLRAAISKATA
jgi:hypothetical protein